MKKNSKLLSLLSLMFITLCFTGLVSCGDDDPGDTPTPKQTISVRSCSITNGTEYEAASLSEVTISYNATVAISNADGILLNGVKCSAKSSSSTAMDVIITLPALEEGKSYTLNIAEGAIVSKTDASVKAPAYSVSFTTKAAPPPPEPINNDATALTKRLGWGWNLGNHFDTSSGEDGVRPQWGFWDGATPTEQLYKRLKAAGVSTVRICVTWGNYQDVDDTWGIDPEYLLDVMQNVDWAEAAGLNVILNMHHDEYWLDIKGAATSDVINQQIKHRIWKTWQQVAYVFKDKGDFLFFETFNEVQDGQWGWGGNLTDGGKQYRILNEWNQTAVDAIRAQGDYNETRWIGVPAYASSPKFAVDDNFKLPTDPANRIMVSVHFYDPSNFTLTPENGDGKTEWGHTAAAGKFVPGSNEEHVVETFQQLQEKYIANNIPVYIGEYGCVMQKTDRSNLFRNYYLEYVCRAAHTYNLPVCIWDNNATGGGNEHHGYFNHNDGTYLNGMESLVKTMIKATTSDDASYTLESVYNKAP